MLNRIRHHIQTRPFADARENESKTGNCVDPFIGFKSATDFFYQPKHFRQIKHEKSRELYEHIDACLNYLKPAEVSLETEWQQLEQEHRHECMKLLSRVY